MVTARKQSAGIAIKLISIAMFFFAIVRVIGGVHFVTDVCAGALLGVLAGLISNYVFLIC